MKNKLFTSTTALVLGVLILFIGYTLESNYKDAIASGYEVSATVVEVVKKEAHDSDFISTYDVYTAYVDYEVDGKAYHHIKAGKYTKPILVGQTLTLVVNPNNPGKKALTGEMFSFVGIITTLASIVCKIRKRKKSAT